MIAIKRVYEPPLEEDGFRVLVDRLWPRGLSKDKAKIDLWLKEIAPSDGLRKWFSHDPKKWPEFKRRYREELRRASGLRELKKIAAGKKKVTLLYGAKEERCNNAAALLGFLR